MVIYKPEDYLFTIGGYSYFAIKYKTNGIRFYKAKQNPKRVGKLGRISIKDFVKLLKTIKVK